MCVSGVEEREEGEGGVVDASHIDVVDGCEIHHGRV